MIKTLASKRNYPIFIVNPNNINLANLNNILTPQVNVGDCDMKLVLFEDFDRFLSDSKVETVMSAILNSLDGLDDKGGYARFFTGNNCDIIFNNPALINRMSNKLKFELPVRGMFEGKLKRLFTFYSARDIVIDQTQVDKYLDLVTAKNVTLRPFTNYTIRHMFYPDFMDRLIDNIGEL